MYVYVRMCVCMYMYVCVYVCICTHVCMYVYVRMCVCMYARMYVRMYSLKLLIQIAKCDAYFYLLKTHSQLYLLKRRYE